MFCSKARGTFKVHGTKHGAGERGPNRRTVVTWIRRNETLSRTYLAAKISRAHWIYWALVALLVATAQGQSVPDKTNTSSSRLLLPLYEVDTESLFGTSTLFAIRNQSNVPVSVDFSYYTSDVPQTPFHTETQNFAAKEVLTFNVRNTPGLAAEADGFARGFVIIETSTEGARLVGDTFRITPAEDFASGKRLLNIGPTSSHNDLCSTFSMRFLNGGGFDSGTIFGVWLDSPIPPTGTEPVFFISAYDEDGQLLLTREYFSDKVTFQVTADELLLPAVTADFGAIEFQFAEGILGHVSGLLNASGRYSVGLEAACGDF